MGETRHWQVEIQSPSLTRTEIGLEQYSCLATPPLLFGSVVFGVQHGLTICLNIVTNGSTWNWWPLHVRPLARKHVRTQCASYPHDLIYCTCVLFPGPQLNTLWFCSEIHNKKNTNIHTDYSATGETPIFSILCSSVGSWGHWLQPSRPCRASEPFASQLGSWYFRLSLQKNPLRGKAALVSWQKHGTGQTLQVASAIISCCQSNGNLNQNKMTQFWDVLSQWHYSAMYMQCGKPC